VSPRAEQQTIRKVDTPGRRPLRFHR
jgi:hypothetical protein